MNQLPTEIFQHLLTIISEEIRSGVEPWNVYIPLFQLRLVSTSWMVAIDSHPPLWTLLTTRHGEKLFSLALERSGMLPLHVDLWCSTYNDPMQYISAVARVSPRWLSLHVAWEWRAAGDALKSLLLTSAPQLRTVSFSRLNEIAQSVHWFDGAAPRLQTVIMDRSLPNWNSLLMWDLKRLVIRWMVRVGENEFEGLIQVISASPGLEELEIVGWSESISIEGVLPVRVAIPLDRLRKLRLRQFPWRWAISLLDAIKIPDFCISDVFLDVPGSGPQVDAASRLLKKELAQASTVAISLLAQAFDQTIGFACISTTASRTEVKFTESTYTRLSNADEFQVWSGIHGLETDVQDLGVPVNLSITCKLLEQYHPSSTQEFSSMMVTADPLLPLVTKVTLDNSSLSLFLKETNWSRFTNLSEFEIKNVDDQNLLDGAAKWIVEWSVLANSKSNVTALKTVTLMCKNVGTATGLHRITYKRP